MGEFFVKLLAPLVILLGSIGIVDEEIVTQFTEQNNQSVVEQLTPSPSPVSKESSATANSRAPVPTKVLRTSILPAPTALPRPKQTLNPLLVSTPTPEPFSVSFTSPSNGSSFRKNDKVRVEAVVTGDEVDRVEFAMGSDFHLATLKGKPYVFELDLSKHFYGITGNQSTPLSVRAYNSDGIRVYHDIVITVRP